MVSPKQPTGSLLPTKNKRPSSSSDDVPPFSKHPEVDDALPFVKRLKGDDNVNTLEKKLMLPSENSKELHSTDQPELEAGNVAYQKVNDTADEKSEVAADGKIEAPADKKIDVAADGKGDAAVDGGVFTPAPVGKYFFIFYFLSPSTLVTPYRRQGFVSDKPWCRLISEYAENPTLEVNKTFLAVGANKDTPDAAMTCFIRLVNANCSVTIGVTFTCWDQCRKRKTVEYRKPVLDGLELDSAANIGSNNAADFELSIGTDSEERWWITGLMPASTSEMSSKSAAVMEKLDAAIIDRQNIEVSFDDSPCYLSENRKHALIATSYLHLKHNEQVKYINELPAVNPRIFLSGPAGSEIYQEIQVKALPYFMEPNCSFLTAKLLHYL
ncbi:hypothetical protein P3S67_009482 [Capsicum chacoense]